MKVLYIFKHDPFGISGGSKASRHFFEAFETIYANVSFDILVADSARCTFPSKILEKHCVHFVPARNNANRLLSCFTRIIHRYHAIAKKMMTETHYDLCIFDHSSIAGSLCDIAQKNDTKTIVIHHNVEQVFFRDNNPFLKRVFFSTAVSYNEKKAYKSCNYNIFLTEEDQSAFDVLYGKSEKKKIALYIFEGKDDNTHTLSKRQNDGHLNIVITGSLCNVQNVDGLTYFFGDLYGELPNNTFVIIAGRKPTAYVKQLISGKDNVRLVENPKDINQIVREGDIFLCPTRLGSGIKVRITDGLRVGLPIVAHVTSARGYRKFIERGYFLTFSNKKEFAKSISSFSKKIDTCFKDEIRSFYEKECNFESCVRKLSLFIEEK